MLTPADLAYQAKEFKLRMDHARSLFYADPRNSHYVFTGIDPEGTYAQVFVPTKGLVNNEVVLVLNFGQSGVNVATSSGRLVEGLSTDYAAPEGYHARLRADYKNLPAGATLVSFQEWEEDDVYTLYDFNGKSYNIPASYLF